MPSQNTKTCAQCGAQFTSYPSANRKFCSRRCFEISHRKPFDRKPCVVCGIEIVPYATDTRATYAQRKTCGRACGGIVAGKANTGRVAWNAMPPLDPRPCATCDKPFIPTIRKNPGKYCSRVCFHAGRSAGHHDEAFSSLKKAKITKVCERCRVAFLANPWNADKRRWCGRACTDAAHREIVGAEHPLYKPKVEMACEVCGVTRMVKPSLVSRFRACSRRCASIIGKETMPRSSSLEVAVAAELSRIGVAYEQQRRFGYYVVDFFLPEHNLVLEADGTYWHSQPKQRRIDASKDGYMRTHGIGIAHIPEAAIKADVVQAVRDALSS